MEPSFLKTTLAVGVILGVAGGPDLGPEPIPGRPEQPTTAPSQADASADRTLNYKLAKDFLIWLDTRYVRNMLTVNGRTTDINDSLKVIGFDATVKRLNALRCVDLDYAMEHPDQQGVPDRHLVRIASTKYELVVANTWSSKKWIDFRDAALRKGVIAFYAREARVTVPFYRKLLTTPIPPETTEFRDLIRAAVSREEYERLVRKIGSGNADFYTALKEGVTWYAPWSPAVKRALDRMSRKSRALWVATPDLIYER
jgi:hypothetical protein